MGDIFFRIFIDTRVTMVTSENLGAGKLEGRSLEEPL